MDASLNRQAQPLGQLDDGGPRHTPAQLGEGSEVGLHGHTLVQRELARQIPDAFMDPNALEARVHAEDTYRARRRADEIEERADRRGLPGAVGSQESERLARGDLEGQVLHAPRRAVTLGQRPYRDDARRSHPAANLLRAPRSTPKRRDLCPSRQASRAGVARRPGSPTWSGNLLSQEVATPAGILTSGMTSVVRTTSGAASLRRRE